MTLLPLNLAISQSPYIYIYIYIHQNTVIGRLSKRAGRLVGWVFVVVGGGGGFFGWKAKLFQLLAEVPPPLLFCTTGAGNFRGVALTTRWPSIGFR